jgi:hypothetical protein
MAAAIGNLGHDLLTDIVGWLWVVLYVGIHAVLSRLLAIPFQRGDDEHPHWQRSYRRGSLHTNLVVVSRCPGSNIIGE